MAQQVHFRQLPKSAYLATTWTLFAVAACFLAARLLIRLRIHGHLMIDDGLVILSMCMITAVCIIETVQVNTDLQVQAVQLGHHKPPPGFAARALTFSHFQWAIAYLWITGVWAVKGSFLAFYDGLTQRLLWYRRAWYVAIVLTILTYMGFLFCYAFLDGRQLKQGPRSEAIYYQFSVDIVTDVLITGIPLTLCFVSKMPVKKKIALAVVFSMTLIITILSILRFAFNSPTAEPAGSTWIHIWSTAEHSVAISVACIASFRSYVLYKNTRHDDSDRTPSKTPAGAYPTAQKRSIADKVGFGQLQSIGSNSRGKEPSERSEGSMDLQLLDLGKDSQPPQSASVFDVEDGRGQAAYRQFIEAPAPHAIMK